MKDLKKKGAYLGVIEGYPITSIEVSQDFQNLAKIDVPILKSHIFKLMAPSNIFPDEIGEIKKPQAKVYSTTVEEDLRDVILYFKIEIRDGILIILSTDFRIKEGAL
ncbi:MAG: hypothetical protein PHY93_15110 [Bacteriovorax sp.]|nr:hypothetical protein [Bacteriovorax sp.]